MPAWSYVVFLTPYKKSKSHLFQFFRGLGKNQQILFMFTSFSALSLIAVTTCSFLDSSFDEQNSSIFTYKLRNKINQMLIHSLSKGSFLICHFFYVLYSYKFHAAIMYVYKQFNVYHMCYVLWKYMCAYPIHVIMYITYIICNKA